MMKLNPMPGQDLTTTRIYNEKDPAITDCTAEIHGFAREWKEFVPENYTPDRSWPLVISLHGGDLNSACKFTWPMNARRDGFIVVYPQAVSKQIMWNVYNCHTHEEGWPDDAAYLDALYDIICHKYNIDKERVYLHGQSFGDIMGSWYLMTRSSRFAAASPSSGPTPASAYFAEDGTELLAPEAAVPIFRTHGEHDVLMPGSNYPEDLTEDERCEHKFFASQLANLEVWKRKNGVTNVVPQVALRDNWNIWFWPSEDGTDVGFVSMADYEHNPHPDFADNMWNYFLSAYRRVDGKIVRGQPIRRFNFCTDNVALADGSDTAYIGGKLIKMDGKAQLLTGVKQPRASMYTPVTLMREAYGAQIVYDDDGLSAVISLNGRTVQVAAGIRGAVLNGDSVHMLPLVIVKDDILYIPFGETAQLLTDSNFYTRGGASYISKERGTLTLDSALLIRTLLGADSRTTPQSWLEAEGLYPGDPQWYLVRKRG